MLTRHESVNAAISPVLRSLHGSAQDRGPHGERLTPMYSFITISRQAGVDATILARRVAERLNLELPPAPRRWSVFDQELVDKVAADHHFSRELVEMLEHSNRTWLEEFFRGVSSVDRHRPSDSTVVRSLVSTVRALAQAGLVILVGRGSVMITHDMPGGLHVRLVAPLQNRIETMMHANHESSARAAERVRALDEERIAFFRHYWPQLPLVPETFDLTLNAGTLRAEQMAACVVDLAKTLPQAIAA